MRRAFFSIMIALSLFMIAGTAQAAVRNAELTVTKTTTVPTTDVFSFALAGPMCGGKSINQTFTLASGQSKVFVLCDSPADKAGRFVVTELTPPAGWQLNAINCQQNDKDPRDAFIVEAPSAFVEFSPGEHKACTFVNSSVPKPPVVTPPTPVVTQPAVPATPSKPPVTTSVHQKSRCKHGRHVYVIKRGKHKGEKAITCKHAPGNKRRVRQPDFTG